MKYIYRTTKRSDIKAYDRNGKTFYAVFLRVKQFDGTIKQIHRHGFPTFKEAASFILSIKAKHEGKSTVPLKIVANEYMESLKHHDLSPNTIKSKASSLKYILKSFGEVPICDITPLMVKDWKNQLVKTLKPQTVNEYSKCLSCILNYAMVYYSLESNSAKIAYNLRVKVSDRKKKNLWNDEILKKALEFEDDESFRVLWTLLYYSGLRIGEALGLYATDIREDGIFVTRQRTQNDQVINPKDGSKGKILLHPEVLDILRDYIRKTGIMQGFIFPYSYPKVYKRLQRLCKMAQVPSITPHDLRHSSITNDANRGVPLIALQAKARHRRASTTEQYYIHTSEETQQLLNFDYKIVRPNENKPTSSKERK